MGYGGWGQFLARTAARKVVYVLVGLALAAVLAATGVRAAALGGPLSVPGVEDSNATYGAVNRLTEMFATDGAGVSVTITESVTSGELIGVWCTDTDAGPATVPGSGPAAPFTLVFDVPAASSCYVFAQSEGFYPGLAGAGTWATEGDVSVTAPPASLTCDPYCVVALADVDRERIDSSYAVMIAGMGLGVFLLTVIAITTGLRRL